MKNHRISKNEARKVYEDMSNYSNSIGAYIFTTQEEHEKYRLHERMDEMERDCELIGTPDNLNEASNRGRLVFMAPSPWHALINLHVNNRTVWLSGDNGFYTRMSLLYRGQRDPVWDIEPSINRAKDREKVETTINIYIKLLNYIYNWQSFTNIVSPQLIDFDGNREDLNYLHVATAQHYGVPTDLIDFSTDPAVAVWFANSGKEGEIASVYALPSLFGKVLKAGIILPHPYVSNLYNQRGLFLSVQKKYPNYFIKQHCIEIRFPCDPDFSVLRKGKKVKILEDEPWWQRLKQTAETLADEYGNDNFSDLDNDEIGYKVMDNGLFNAPFMYADKKVQLIQDNYYSLLQMLFELCLYFNGGSTPKITDNIFDAILATHSGSLEWIKSTLSQYNSSIPKGFVLRTAADLLLEHLKKY